MKNLENIFFRLCFITLCALIITACKKDSALDVVPQDRVSDLSTWTNESTADVFLNDIYNSLPDLNNMFDPFENWSDNSICGFSWPFSIAVISKGLFTPNDYLAFSWWPPSTWLEWSTLYANIRKCNVFISNVETSGLPDTYKTKRLGEARFIRAFNYHYLWMFFGGVPIITKPDNRVTDGDAIFHSRATFDETFRFLDEELTAISNSLPQDNDPGRITKGAALTLKGWIELFYASPLNNTANDVSRWATAAATSKQVMGLGYVLYPDYAELFVSKGNVNKEGIFYRQYIPRVKGGRVESFLGPRAVNNTIISWGALNPTQELVDDYNMDNGKPITDPSSGYNPNNPYANREPRFYQSIVYDGAFYYKDIIYTRPGVGSLNEIDLSDRDDATQTGYYVRKRMDTTINIEENYTGVQNSGQNWYYFRYADVLLNYAEAQNEAIGPDVTVYGAMDELRVRAGIPPLSVLFPGMSKDQMREAIRKERRIELAFENKRWWDLIRWKTAEINLNQNLHGMLVRNVGGILTYTPIEALHGQREFFPNKNYLRPIPQSALDQNPKLQGQQNPGY